MAITTRIDLPAPSRVAGGLLSAARPLPSGWERGVTFGGSSCLAPQPWPYCISEDESPWEKTPNAPGDISVFEPTGIVQAVECTTLSRDSSQQKASEALAATADYQLGTELYDGAVTGNPHLTQAVSAGAGGTSYASALAVIEAAIASELQGRLGFVHASYASLTRLLSESAIWRDGRFWRTAAGNLVVTSPGYDFARLYATGEVFAAVSAPETRVDIDRAVNQSVAYAEQIGLAVFDPCFNVYSEVSS